MNFSSLYFNIAFHISILNMEYEFVNCASEIDYLLTITYIFLNIYFYR